MITTNLAPAAAGHLALRLCHSSDWSVCLLQSRLEPARFPLTDVSWSIQEEWETVAATGCIAHALVHVRKLRPLTEVEQDIMADHAV